jgi:hypothetical protein
MLTGDDGLPLERAPAGYPIEGFLAQTVKNLH